MRFPELDSFRKDYPQLSDLLSQFQLYLGREFDRAERTNPGLPPHDIRPSHLSTTLHIDEGLALSLLMLAHEAGLVFPEYKIYCPETDNFLGAYPSLAALPPSINCPYHDDGEIEHNKTEYLTEVVFHFAMPRQRHRAIAV